MNNLEGVRWTQRQMALLACYSKKGLFNQLSALEPLLDPFKSLGQQLQQVPINLKKTVLFALMNKKQKKDPPFNSSTWSFENWGDVHYISILNNILPVTKQSAQQILSQKNVRNQFLSQVCTSLNQELFSSEQTRIVLQCEIMCFLAELHNLNINPYLKSQNFDEIPLPLKPPS